MTTQFVKGQLVEYSNNDALFVGDVIEDGDVTYAILFSGERYAAAYELAGDGDNWYFVNDDDNTFKLHLYQALAQIVVAMKERHELENQ